MSVLDLISATATLLELEGRPGEWHTIGTVDFWVWLDEATNPAPLPTPPEDTEPLAPAPGFLPPYRPR